MSETGRGFLRQNEPAAARWYARDVTAIAAARGLINVAPYFIDAAASKPPVPNAPEGGLTVVSFRNSHLQYALTWFALAMMVTGGAFLVFRYEWRLRNAAAS
jgi:surfeit locus 1 family protein